MKRIFIFFRLQGLFPYFNNIVRVICLDIHFAGGRVGESTWVTKSLTLFLDRHDDRIVVVFLGLTD